MNIEQTGKDIRKHARALVQDLPQACDTREQFLRYMQARIATAGSLERLLARALDLTESFPLIQTELQKNLDDEQGIVNGVVVPEKAHATHRARLAQGLEISINVRGGLDATLEEVFSSDSLSLVLGVIYYLEESIPREYAEVLRLVRKFFGRDDERDFYLVDHIKHDAQHHAPDLRKALQAELKNEDEFLAGVELMKGVKEQFYAQF